MTVKADSSDTPARLPSEHPTVSFWHSEPSEFLLGHHTTPELPECADIVIIGSGITGTSIARFLADDSRSDGKSIVMLEAREACWGATGRNGGHCQPLLFDRTPEIAEFELANIAAVKSYIEANEIPCEWRSVTGCRSFWSEEIMSMAERAVAALKKARPDIGKLITITRDPEIMKQHRIQGAVGITLTEGAGQLWPYKYVAYILEKLIKNGRLNLQVKTTVTAIEQIPTTMLGDAQGARYVVQTRSGNIRARHVALATNGYTSHLLPEFTDLIVPCRGEMSALLPPEGSSRLPNSYGFQGAKGHNINHDEYLVQRPFQDVPNPAGHLMFGGGRGVEKEESLGLDDDSVIDEDAAKYLRKTLLESLILGGNAKDLKELKATHEWTGIMGYSRDDTPWVGPIPDNPGLWLAGGYTGHGMPNGTLCGKALANMILTWEEGLDLENTEDLHRAGGEMPRSYLVTTERLKQARNMPTVMESDRLGLFRLYVGSA
ncbi:FAD dependent oxidoreductase-like protein [Patellaria atrata CBS 101060]|uniref:FAD dependent oxidoreductase-like protein n=1 Tax=Patellaria atrata CBS 101060 TaxID=1346257 RepID=A0A9P4VTJ8_9PEZI|nr:FAD dependent oxidoreductase-like protein [Patellaria atrata CBS 101060]